jgi:prepilin-type N-terminal cleavage/methylation domain-containing protein
MRSHVFNRCGGLRKPIADGGVTLVEVLVAVTILSIALLGYLTVIEASHNSMTDGSEFSLASKAISDSTAAERGLGFSSLSNGTTTVSVKGLINGTLTTVIGPMPSAPLDQNLKELDMTVSWISAKSAGAETTTLTQSALMSNHS